MSFESPLIRIRGVYKFIQRWRKSREDPNPSIVKVKGLDGEWYVVHIHFWIDNLKSGQECNISARKTGDFYTAIKDVPRSPDSATYTRDHVMDGLTTILVGLGIKNEKLKALTTIIYEIFNSVPEDIQDITNNMSNMSLRMRNKKSLSTDNKEYNRIVKNFDTISSDWAQHIEPLKTNNIHHDRDFNLKDHIKQLKQNSFHKWLQSYSLLGTHMGTLNQHHVLEDMRIFLEWWQKCSPSGRLYILGLSQDDIDNCFRCLNGIKSPGRLYYWCLLNPYRLAPISMDKCKEIMTFLHKEPTSEQKECGSIVRQVYTNTFEPFKGWMGTPISNISYFDQYQDILVREYGLTVRYNLVYLKIIDYVEAHVAEYIDLLSKDTNLSTMEDTDVHKSSLADEQKQSVKAALNHAICIITGGAGTGKTTIIRELVQILDLNRVSYVVCSFTGKAISRLKDLMPDIRAATIHRLIHEAKQSRNKKYTTYQNEEDEEPPDSYETKSVNTPKKIMDPMIKDCKHLIIEEASMVSVQLFYGLISAYPNRCRITIIGDTNQLSGVGFGSLMDQLQKSNIVPTFKLVTNHRHYGSLISQNANILIDGLRDSQFQLGEDFRLMSGGMDKMRDMIEHCYRQQCPVNKLTVICPEKKYRAEINKLFQHIYLKDKLRFIHNKVEWRVGDRVMQLKNNYNINVMNGDEGTVQNITNEGVVVTFENKRSLTYRFYKRQNKDQMPLKGLMTENEVDQNEEKESDIPEEIGFALVDENQDSNDDQPEADNLPINHIEHSFAVTIHKSQGSEYDYVLIYIPESKISGEFLNLNMLYTAITRGRIFVCIIGDDSTINNMASQLRSVQHQALKNRLIDLNTRS